MYICRDFLRYSIISCHSDCAISKTQIFQHIIVIADVVFTVGWLSIYFFYSLVVNWTVQLGLALQRPSSDSDFVSRHLVVAILHPRTLASRIPESTCTSTTDVVVSTQEVE